MDRAYIEKHNVIERYLLGKLSEEEASAFEDRFVFDEELRGEIDLTEKLIEGLQRRDGERQRDESAGPQEAASRRNLIWAMAAVLAMLAVLLPFFYVSTPSIQETDSSQPFELFTAQPAFDSAPLLELRTTRAGNTSAPTARLPILAGPNAVAILKIPVEEDMDSSSLSVSISEAGGLPVWSGTWPDSGDVESWLFLVVPSHALSDGDYLLAIGDASQRRVFRFRAYTASLGVED